MKTRRDFVLQASKGVCGLGLTSLASTRTASGGPGRGTGLVYEDAYLKHVLSPDHPESPMRLRKVREELKRSGLDQHVTRLEPLQEAMPFIEKHHTPQHVASVKQIPVTGPVAALAVAGGLGAVRAVAGKDVRNAFCAIRPPGHHANNTGGEEGFCFYSNAAIAAKYVQSFGFEKILIIDWDYHHGNGTQNAFYEDPTVLFFSTHDWQAYPGTGDPSLTGAGEGKGLNINVHLDCGAKDKDMLGAWDRKLLSAVEKFKPDFVLVSAGFDSRKEDLLGCFAVTDDGFRRMTRTAMDIADHYCGGRLVSLLEGGYNLDGLAKAVAAHVATLLG
ncbi:MAG: histone deacetylase [Acidobacteriota bacterium]